MRTTILLGTFVVCAAPAIAVLPPTTSATLAQHMLEVNSQWRAQDPLPFDALQTARFTNEADRIAQHLHMVRERLAVRGLDGLSHEQLANRLTVLAKLDAYADRGRFPLNYVLPYRNPVFIDPHGTACAVGQLIIESGNRDLAERISSEMNLAYVLDMQTSPLWPEIAAWANEHGFTAEELAWIQPAYAPNYPWIPLGGGTNGTVSVVKKLANGDLLVAGEFTDAGGVAVNQVAIWNGSTYSPLGTGLSGTINCAVEYDGALYVGGAMLGGPNDLAKWDGSYWNFATVFNGKYPLINALHVHDGLLYAAGEMSGFAGTTNLVQVFDGAQWTPVGSPFNGPVNALATHHSALVAAGAFTSIESPSLPPPVLHVAVMGDVDWAQLGDGLDAPVHTLLDVNGTLYAGGDLFANIVVRFGLARIADTAETWELLLPNHGDYMNGGPGPSWIGSMVEFNNGIFVGGNFSISYMVGLYGNNVGWFNGTLDELQPMIVVDAEVKGVAIHDQNLIVGGAFDATYSHVVSLDLTTAVVDPAERVAFTLAPNPATDILRLTIGDMSKVNMTVTITDVSGRVVATLAKGSAPSMAIDVSHLPAGSYQLRTEVDGAVSAQRFVKQ